MTLDRTRLRRRSALQLAAGPRPIPGPRQRYPGQFLRALATDRLNLFSDMARHGDVSQIVIARQPIVVLTHPDDIRRVLVDRARSFVKGRGLERTKKLLGNGLLTSEGEHHLRQRRLVQPAFHRERLAAYADAVPRWCARIERGWADGAARDMHADMMRLTLGVAGECFFGVDVERDAETVAEVMELSLRMFDYSILPLGELLELAPLRWVRRLQRARERMDARIAELIAERRADGGERSDLLSTLVAAADDQGAMTDQQLRDEIVTLMMAGHETTANALTWTWYLLATHPAVEYRLHQELERVLGGRAPTAADLAHLPYTRAVLSESMRLYPPAWTVERRAVEDVPIGRHLIRSGTIVLTTQFLVHRDRRWWSEPDEFRPERWLVPGDSAARPRMAYFPFGAGTRICVGEHFAWMEGMVALATLAQRWRMRYESQRAPLLEPLVTLRPKGGLSLRLVARPDRGGGAGAASRMVGARAV